MVGQGIGGQAADARSDRFARHLLAVYAGIGVNGVIGAGAVLVAARFLGPSGYGIFAIYAVMGSYFAVLDSGIGKSLQRRVASETEEVPHLQAAFASYLAVATVLVLLLPALLYAVPRILFPVPLEAARVVRWVVVIAVAEYLLAIPTTIVQTSAMAHERFDRYSRWLVVSGLYRSVLVVASAVMFRSPLVTVALVAGRRIVDLMVAPRIMDPLPTRAWRPRFEGPIFDTRLRESAGLAAVQFLQVTVVGVGAVLVNSSLGLTGLGLYRAQFDLASKLWVLSTGIGLVAFPRFSRLMAVSADRPDRESRSRLQDSFETLLTASWSAYHLLAIAAALLVPALARAASWHDSGATALLALLLLGVVMNAHASLGGELLVASRRYVFVIGANLVALLTLAGGFLASVGSLGMLSIGFAWVASQLLFATLIDFGAACAIGLPLASGFRVLAFKYVLLAAAAAALFGSFGRLSLAFAVAGALIVAGTLLMTLLRLSGSSKGPIAAGTLVEP